VQLDAEGLGHERAASLDPTPGAGIAAANAARRSASASAIPSSMFVVK
jgi:hypothetical protein